MLQAAKNRLLVLPGGALSSLKWCTINRPI